MNRGEVTDILSSSLNRYERKLNHKLVVKLAESFFKRQGSLSLELQEEDRDTVLGQLLFFLVYHVVGRLEVILDLRRKYSEYTKLYTKAGTLEDRGRYVLDFAHELGASRRQLRGDQKAFARWFGNDAVKERYERRHNRLEREVTFVLERIGVLAGTRFGRRDEDVTAVWKRLDLAKMLKPFFAYEGDGRVRVAAFRCLSLGLRALPAKSQQHSVDEGTVQFIYRCAMHARLDVWLQCEALSLLESLSASSFKKVLTQRLRQPAKGDDIFVRRRALHLLGKNLTRLPSLAKLLPVAGQDPSPFVRQAIADILIDAPVQLASVWFQYLSTKDAVPQVRAATLVTALKFLGRPELHDTVLTVLKTVLREEEDPFVLRVAMKVGADGAERFAESSDAFLSRWQADITEELDRLHINAESLSVRRWAALAREAIWCVATPEARTLKTTLHNFIAPLRPGERQPLPATIRLPQDEDLVGRVLSVIGQGDFGCELDVTGNALNVTKGHLFGFKLWRFLHEVRNPSPDKRQAFPHSVGRVFPGTLRAPSNILCELAETRVPGEPLFIPEEGGWRPYLPLLDELHASLEKKGRVRPVKIFTSEGITKIVPPGTQFGRWIARAKIGLEFQKYAKMRNWRRQLQESPDSYLRELKKLGFEVTIRPYPTADGGTTSMDPAVQRFFPLALPISPGELWSRLQEYFVSVYDNSLFELALFTGLVSSMFVGRHVYANVTVRRWRDRLPLVVGGWGTRGKSGTERLKAALFNALGYAVMSKTTGCEAMFLSAHAFGKTREMFLFRPYDKATIWEQRDVIKLAQQLGADVFLWECMALTPAYVDVLQQHWVRDDISTITNTYPDHEDLQGPAGFNIPEVISIFIPSRSKAITTEEQMLPILTDAAREKKTSMSTVGWLEPGLLAPDVLQRFPYDEHPNNIALVLALADELGIDRDFALKEMADRVVADLGVLKTSPVARIRSRRLQFTNGCSANERHGALGNWDRCGFYDQDRVAEPGVWITTVVNCRADRIPRARVFARIMVEDISVDRHFLIGGNLTGMLGYLKQLWDTYAPGISLWPKDSTTDADTVFKDMTLRFRQPTEKAHVTARLQSMLAAAGSASDLGTSLESLCNDPGALLKQLNAAGAEALADAILRHHEKNLKLLDEYETFSRKIRKTTREQRVELDTEFRALLWKWFQDKLVVVQDYHISGEQLVNLIAEETPPGYLNRMMGMQNIKGTGLDFVYRWQAWDTCHKACTQLASNDPAVAEQGLRTLGSFQEYGILAEEHVREALDSFKSSPVAQSESLQAELAMVVSNFSMAQEELREKLNVARQKTSRFEILINAVESFFDAGDAVKRRKIANQIYRDLTAERISYERAAQELQALNKRQKGGWLIKKILAAHSKLSRRLSRLFLRSLKG